MVSGLQAENEQLRANDKKLQDKVEKLSEIIALVIKSGEGEVFFDVLTLKDKMIGEHTLCLKKI